MIFGYATVCLLVGSLVSLQGGALDAPHVLELRVRMLFLRTGMSEKMAPRVLGLEHCLLGGGGGTFNSSAQYYPVRQRHSLWLLFAWDSAAGEMQLYRAVLREHGH
jgi:hypothetical protein